MLSNSKLRMVSVKLIERELAGLFTKVLVVTKKIVTKI